MRPNEPMTPKERWLAAIRLQPVDRLPFWPKLNASYPRAQAKPFRDMTIDALHDWMGSDKHIGIEGCLKENRQRTSVEISAISDTQRTIFRTPGGELELIKRFDETSQSWHPIRFPVKRVEDIELMSDIFLDISLSVDKDALARAKKQFDAIGMDALTANTIGKSALMDWVEWLAGIETAHILLFDYREEVEALFEAIHQVLLKKTEILAENSVADVLYLSENTSTTLISPAQYQRYSHAHIQQYATIARQRGKPLILHMCGHLKALLRHLNSLPVEAFEAFTSPTMGDTTLLDGRVNCPQKCLIGGTNAVLWTRSSAEITAQIERDLDSLPHHCGIVVTSAGVMPPLCQPETIKAVCEWVRRYPVRMDSASNNEPQ